MAFSTTWDIDKYKSEYESDEHWELRKSFMLTHKDEFPEDKLVCLARVFFNVEFLGCRYPEQTMKLIADLSKGVADDHREKQKGKLKRTFVKASDAAGAKIKRTQTSSEPPNKNPKSRELQSGTSNFQYTSFVHEDLVKPEMPAETGEFPGFIIFENCNSLGIVETCPINIITHSAQKSSRWNSVQFLFLPEKNLNKIEKCCTIKINNKVLSSGQGSTVKEAKQAAAVTGLKILQKTYFTIQAKHAFFSQSPSVNKDGAPLVEDRNKPLPQDNIGSKMMQKMGWTGTGLGKQKQGIQNPIQASSQIMRREGLGSINERQFHDRFRQMFKEYITSGSDGDLVFAPDFSSDERKVLHRLAQNLQLKTRSYGKDQDRHLVVYKPLSLPLLLETLLACGGENDKYLLIPPAGEDSCNPSVDRSRIKSEIEHLKVSVEDNLNSFEEDSKYPNSISRSEPNCVDTGIMSEKIIGNQLKTFSECISNSVQNVDCVLKSQMQNFVNNNFETDVQEEHLVKPEKNDYANLPIEYQKTDSNENIKAHLSLESPNETLRPHEETPSAASLQLTCNVQTDSINPHGPAMAAELPGFIVFKQCDLKGKVDDDPSKILLSSGFKNTYWKPLKFSFPRGRSCTQKLCELRIKDKLIASGYGKTNKKARSDAALKGLEVLQKSCYTIQEKFAVFIERCISKADILLPLDNICEKKMQTLDQKDERDSSQRVESEDLGIVNGLLGHDKYFQIFKDYAASNTFNDLIFTKDFTKVELKELKGLATRCQLRRKLIHHNGGVYLVVRKDLSLPLLLEALLACGGENDKYLLIPPTEEVCCPSITNSSSLFTQTNTTTSNSMPREEQLLKVEHKMAIALQGYPKHKLTDEQAEIIQEALMGAMQPLESGNYPAFTECNLERGALIIKCTNQETKEWLVTVTPSLLQSWDNVKLFVGDLKDLLRVTKVVFRTPRQLANSEPSKILKMLDNQNRKLNATAWKIIKTVKRDSSKTIVCLVNDEEALEAIQENKNRAFLGLWRIRFTILAVKDVKEKERSNIEFIKLFQF